MPALESAPAPVEARTPVPGTQVEELFGLGYANHFYGIIAIAQTNMI